MPTHRADRPPSACVRAVVHRGRRSPRACGPRVSGSWSPPSTTGSRSAAVSAIVLALAAVAATVFTVRQHRRVVQPAKDLREALARLRSEGAVHDADQVATSDRSLFTSALQHRDEAVRNAHVSTVIDPDDLGRRIDDLLWHTVRHLRRHREARRPDPGSRSRHPHPDRGPAGTRLAVTGAVQPDQERRGPGRADLEAAPGPGGRRPCSRRTCPGRGRIGGYPAATPAPTSRRSSPCWRTSFIRPLTRGSPTPADGVHPHRSSPEPIRVLPSLSRLGFTPALPALPALSASARASLSPDAVQSVSGVPQLSFSYFKRSLGSRLMTLNRRSPAQAEA